VGAYHDYGEGLEILFPTLQKPTTKTLKDAESFKNNIHVMNAKKQEDVRDSKRLEKARTKIRQAKNIFILGFGFDKQNCDLLFYEKGQHILLNRVAEQTNSAHCNVYYTNMGDSAKINRAAASLLYPNSQEVFQELNSTGYSEKAILQVSGREQRDGRLRTTKSTRSVYDALKYDFSFI
jgi:hypothetical protein